MSENFSLDLLAHEPRRIGELTTEELGAVMAFCSSLQMAVASELVARQSRGKAEPKREVSEETYLTADEVWKLLKLPSAKSVYRLVKKGALPALHVGRRLRFRAVDLRAFAPESPKNVLDFPLYAAYSRDDGAKKGKSESRERRAEGSPRNDGRRAPSDSPSARLDAKADGRVHGDDSNKHRKVRARRAENASSRRRFRPTGLEV